jgi:hypothetical protein
VALLIHRAAAAALVALCAAAHAGQGTETDLKRAYVYNFVVLSAWPAETPPILRFCVAGAVASTPLHVLSGKSAGERILFVAAAPTPAHAVDCHVLYIPAAESGRLGAWLAAVAKQPTLTISDQAPTPGAIVNLRIEENRIVFDVNTRAAAAARIVLSSQLIKLAATRQ